MHTLYRWPQFVWKFHGIEKSNGWVRPWDCLEYFPIPRAYPGVAVSRNKQLETYRYF